MKGILSDKKAISAGIASAVVLTVLRIIQLISCTEYPSLLYAQGCEVFNTVFNILLILSAAVISICAFSDAKNARIKTADEISVKGCNVFGAIMILAGAVWILPVISDFSAGSVGFATITALACCAAYIIGGMAMMMSSKIVPAQCISAVFIIVNYLIVAVKFYLSSPIITGMPQKTMMMLFYVLTLIFWINTGRFMCGGEKKLTRTALTASGYFCTASVLAYIISCYVLLAADSEKWANIAQNSPETLPDLEIIVTAVVPALLAAVIQFSKKRPAENTDGALQSNASDNDNTSSDTEESADRKTAADSENVLTAENEAVQEERYKDGNQQD